MVLGVAAVFVTACGVDEFGLRTGPGAGFVSDQRPAFVVGAWVNNTYVQTAAGLQANEVIWEFGPDGFATRTSTLRNITTGLTTTEVLLGEWGIQGQWLTVLFEPPLGTVRMRFSVQGDRLLLDSREFLRIR